MKRLIIFMRCSLLSHIPASLIAATRWGESKNSLLLPEVLELDRSEPVTTERGLGRLLLLP